MANTVEVIKLLAQSKKYQHLSTATIDRIVSYVASRYPEKQIEEKSKQLLHQIWGAYYSSRPDFKKLLNKITVSLEDSTNIKDVLLPILMIHQSSKERIPVLDSFYKKIFEITGIPKSIIDHGCGLNPLTFPWMDLPPSTSYQSFDIDSDEVQFLNHILPLIGAKNASAQLGDIFQSNFEYADIIFILKIIPLLEHQQKAITSELIQKQNCKFLVVSFPTKTIGGQNKGMQLNYSYNFENILKEAGLKTFHKLDFSNELVYIIDKSAK
jgi:16S rRNA (guanine(1405)-N(7))-methyltransferase